MASPGSNGTIDRITRPARTAGYIPHVLGGAYLNLILDGRPRFTWLEAERMRWDPQVQFGLRILRAPLYGVTWKVHCEREPVGRWIDRELKTIYKRILPRAVRAYEYGVAAGEITFKAHRRPGGKTRVHFDRMLEIHPRHAKPFIFERGARAGHLAGMRVGSVESGDILLDRRHSFWWSGEAQFGDWWGRPRLADAYEPWLEKRGRHGAVESRRLFYKKCAFRGPRIRYPVGRTDMGNEDIGSLVRENQDIARELVEKFENGGVLALPNVKDAQGNDLWFWEDPQSFADVASLLDYPKQLDREILIGLGIPPELVEAATVGSGYSGRAIPAQVFFTSMDEVATLLIEAIEQQILRPLVTLNFGKIGFEIELNSLAQLMAQQGQPGQGGGAPGQPGAAPAAGAEGGGMMPFGVSRNGNPRMKDMATGRVSYGKPKVRLSVPKQAKKRRKINRVARNVKLSLAAAWLWDAAAGPILSDAPEVI